MVSPAKRDSSCPINIDCENANALSVMAARTSITANKIKARRPAFTDSIFRSFFCFSFFVVMVVLIL